MSEQIDNDHDQPDKTSGSSSEWTINTNSSSKIANSTTIGDAVAASTSMSSSSSPSEVEEEGTPVSRKAAQRSRVMEMRGSQSQSQVSPLPSPSPSSSPTLPPDYEDTNNQIEKIAAFSAATFATTIPAKLRRLAATATAGNHSEEEEEEEEISDSSRQQSERAILQLETLVDGENVATQQAGEEDMADGANSWYGDDNDGEEEFVDLQDLSHVHDALASTVQQMRLRSQEQKHLHSLTKHKLQTMAQRSLAQNDRISLLNNSLSAEMARTVDAKTERDALRQENRVLGIENDTLRSQNEEMHAHIKALEAEVQRQSVALTAMTTALTGLEEWMEYSIGNQTQKGHQWAHREAIERQGVLQGPGYSDPRVNGHRFALGNDDVSAANPGSRPKAKTVIRGTGRFRGRYQVDVDDDGDGQDGGGYAPTFNRGRRHEPAPFPLHENMNGVVSINGYHLPSQTSELQDDVRAWIRGCRDVLECAQVGADVFRSSLSLDAAYNHITSARSHATATTDAGGDDEDDWGEFQAVQTVK